MTHNEENMTNQVLEILREDILTRFDNPKYWNFELAEKTLDGLQANKQIKKKILAKLKQKDGWPGEICQ